MRSAQKAAWKTARVVQFDKWKILRGDRVQVCSGRNKGMRGEVKQVIRSRNMVVVEGVNLVKKHQPGSGEMKGGVYTMEAPLPVSKVALIDPTDDKPCRVRFAYVEGGAKVRQSVRSGAVIERNDAVLKATRKIEEGPLDTAPDVVSQSTFSPSELIPKLNWGALKSAAAVAGSASVNNNNTANANDGAKKD